MNTTQLKLPNKRDALSLAAASVLALTACAWGIAGACKGLQEASSATSQTTTENSPSR